METGTRVDLRPLAVAIPPRPTFPHADVSTEEAAPEASENHAGSLEAGNSRAFNRAVSKLMGPARTIHTGAVGSIDAKGKIVGANDIAAQTTQILNNIQARLKAAGASPEHLVGWNIHVRTGEDFHAAVTAGMEWCCAQPFPVVNSV